MKGKAKFRVGQVVAIRDGKLGWARIANRHWNQKMGFSAPCWEYDIRRMAEGEIDPGWLEREPKKKRPRFTNLLNA